MDGKYTIEGHEIAVARSDELGDAVGKKITVTSDGGDISASIAAHPTKSTWTWFTFEGDGIPLDEYMILIPPTSVRQSIGMAEIRPIRSQWTHEDYVHQAQLFDAVGRIAVFGGHVEMAMKKVLITLRGGELDLLDPTLPSMWNQLEDQLKSIKTGPEDIRTRARLLLDEAEQKRLRDRRNDAIHGYWWLAQAHGRLINSRYYPGKQGKPPLSIYTTPAQVSEVGNDLHTLASNLERLVTPYWPLAILDIER
ncbi:hypothetical protein [Mycobacteroides abscessus]|uniref:hypothetical protein n=1 Tax=Mycobacteroides abscessus TaxID=36809 RepID=UPI000925EA00|nr:hypothetical protein [Mycobacteroides abscessus]MBN7437128.1 hypothetical protein [Mycobacteroides abscessus subsp. abscessus]MDM1887781.1 hypothetical protein [Mycobacteroides abscessus]MDM1892298.1 hypothetical protein [Mycobacteroides abscessus]SHQ63713.1 Uncharacterised protein [Mycobacteroides abscessus subsp. abscessus]SHS12687.1 Uncharacterised protein [Mycobacteroides abscessus subsp. abscessus]